MSLRVVITCEKDPVLEKACQELFGEKWSTLARKMNYPEQALPLWQERLREEAARQEWYDFALDGDGKRCVIYETSTHLPKLLVPEVKIERVQ